MTEEQLNALRQQDTNLRDAIWQEEEVRPQMPADLNERLMQRVAAQQEKKPRRIVWPWIAAACAAGVLMIWLTPPKVTETDVVAKQQPKVEKQTPSSILPQNGEIHVLCDVPQVACAALKVMLLGQARNAVRTGFQAREDFTHYLRGMDGHIILFHSCHRLQGLFDAVRGHSPTRIPAWVLRPQVRRDIWLWRDRLPRRLQGPAK